MNLPEINNAAKHLKKISKCPHCKGKYNMPDIDVVATTKNEGLFEMKCANCHNSTIVTVLVTEEQNSKPTIKENTLINDRRHRSISQNDILDVKNFLDSFDGNFKKIFSKKNR